MPLPKALRTCVLLLSLANTYAPALVAFVQTQKRDHKVRQAIVVSLTDLLANDPAAMVAVTEIISNLLGRSVSTFEPLELFDELRYAWAINKMEEWLVLGRHLDVFKPKDLAGWAWILANLEASHGGE
jgi:hypothetical protein